MAIRLSVENKNKKQYLDRFQNNITKRDVSSIPESTNPFSASTAKRDNYQTYPYDYYSGTDCKIFFGDIWVDDIITISWDANQSKAPIYGYSSQYFNAVAKGQFIVQGSLTISFKEVGYLNLIHNIIEEQRSNAKAAIVSKIGEHKVRTDHNLAEYVPRLNDPSLGTATVNYAANGTANIIRENQTIEQILQSKIISSKMSTKILGSNQGKKYRDFEDFAEVLEDAIWGDSNGAPLGKKVELLRADEFDYSSFGGIRVAKNGSYSNCLNILLTFGDINDFRAEHTLVSLNDVHFVSTSMIVSPTGDPIGETYTFFARNINKSLSSSVININPAKLSVDGFNGVTSPEDIDKIEQQLDKQNSAHNIILNLKASLTKDGIWKQENETLICKNDELIDNQAGGSNEFYFNKSEPFLDQLIKIVEEEFNELDNKINVGNSQYIVDVKLNDSNILTMILQQSIPQTKTYRVIAPTRSGFSAPKIITREDLWRDVSDSDNVVLDDLKKRQQYNRDMIEQAEMGIMNSNETLDELRSITSKKKAEELAKSEERQEKFRDGGLFYNIAERKQSRLRSEIDELNDRYADEYDLKLLDRKDRALYEDELQRRETQRDVRNQYDQRQSELDPIISNIEQNISKKEEEKRQELIRIEQAKQEAIKKAEERKKQEAEKIVEIKKQNEETQKAILEKNKASVEVKKEEKNNNPLWYLTKKTNNRYNISEINKKAEPYMFDISFSSKKRDLDPNLPKNILFLESSFDKNAVSRTGAVGLGQMTSEGIADVAMLNKDLARAAGITLPIEGDGKWKDNPFVVNQIQGAKDKLSNNTKLQIEYSTQLIKNIKNRNPNASNAEIYGQYVSGPNYMTISSDEGRIAANRLMVLEKAQEQSQTSGKSSPNYVDRLKNAANNKIQEYSKEFFDQINKEVVENPPMKPIPEPKINTKDMDTAVRLPQSFDEIVDMFFKPKQ